MAKCFLWASAAAALVTLIFQVGFVWTDDDYEEWGNSGEWEKMSRREMLQKMRGMMGQLERRISKRDVEYVEKIQNLERTNQDQKLAVTNLERRLRLADALRQNIPRTCEDIRLLGFQESGDYMVDPDGPGIGDPPITVRCDFSTPDKGVTIITHDKKNMVKVDQCGEPGCHAVPIKYSATARQMKALIASSGMCYQQISYTCSSAPLRQGTQNLAWWIGSDGSKNYYWHGKKSAEHACACNFNKTCVDRTLACNCDANLVRQASDEGSIEAMESLPIVELRFGGLEEREFQPPSASFQTGPLICSGAKRLQQMTSVGSSTSSCRALLQAGNRASGYFMIDGPNGINYQMVKCNFELDPSHPQFQVPTDVKFSQYPVAFDFKRWSGLSSTTGMIVPYQEEVFNYGKGMTKNGVFTVPLDGVYGFSFFFDEGKQPTAVYIRVDGSVVSNMYRHVPTGASSMVTEGTNGKSLLLRLKKGQTVDVYLRKGDMETQGCIRFSGHMVFPTF